MELVFRELQERAKLKLYYSGSLFTASDAQELLMDFRKTIEWLVHSDEGTKAEDVKQVNVKSQA